MTDGEISKPKHPGGRPTMYQTPREKSPCDRYEVRIHGVAPDGTELLVTMKADPDFETSPLMLEAMCYDKFHQKWEAHGG